MLQSTSEYEERNFDDIQRALDIEHTVKALESQLCYDQHSPEEVARQILKAACKFYDADWCGLIQVDLDLKIWTPFWWYNDSSEDKTTILTEEFESAEFLDRWVQAVRHGKPMIVPDAEEVKNTYPAEYNLYQRLGIQSVLGASLEPRPVALLAVRNPKRYISETSILRLLAYVLLVAYKDKKMNDGLNMAFSPENIESSHDVFVSLFGELKIYTSHGILREADLKSPKISRLLTYLLISGKKAHSSLEIAQALWPDDSTNPAKNMRNLIYRLRQTFGLISEKELIVFRKRNLSVGIGHKAATALRLIGSVTEKSKHKPSPSQKWQNCSAFQEKRSTGFSTAKNTETVSLLSAWPTGGALPKPALKHGFSVNLHIRFSHRPKMFQKNLH